jgi:general secretion pathway protein C
LADHTLGYNFRVTTRRLAFVVTAAVAVGAGAWALRLFVPAGSAPAPVNTVEPAVPTSSDQARAVGADLPPAAPGAASVTTGNRFKLVSVAAPVVSVPGSEWLALIAVDGKPPRAFPVGATVEGDIVLREVSARGATLGTRGGGTAIALEVPPAPVPIAETAPEPTADSGLVSQTPTIGTVESRDDLPPSLGSKYLPIPERTWSAPDKPADGTLAPDDGRWRPPSGQ